MLRSRFRRQRVPAALLIAAATVAGGALPSASAVDHQWQGESTLGPRVSTRNHSLDATIASMVKRGLLADVTKTAPAIPSAPSGGPQLKPAAAPAVAKPGSSLPRTAWRPSQPQSALSIKEARANTEPPSALWRWPGPSSAAPAPPDTELSSESTFPTLPLTPPSTIDAVPSDGTASDELALEAPETEPPTDDPETEEAFSSDESVTEESDAAESDASELDDSVEDEATPIDDDLAPIDDLPETPAPAHDAPGDPVEPEYTGDPRMATPAPDAKPLASARSQETAIGEPDRLARPTKQPATTPTNPELYEEAEEAPARPVKLRPLTRNQQLLRNKIRSVLKHYYERPLNTRDRSPWEVMHGMLAYEVHSRVLQGGPQGEPITAVGWLCFNQPCKGRELMYLNEDGDIRVRVGPALQGHHGQLLALLAQARVRSDYPMRIDGQDFTVADLIEMEKATCYPRTELTFKLIGLQRYLDINAKWVNDQGMQWDFPTLVREEMRQPVRTAACGGTHRLSGLTLAIKKRRSSGLPVDGEYAQAARFIANYQNYAFRLQNGDGSFSTEWFKGPGSEPDIDRRLKTTGHTLEWLLYSASEEQLTYHRTVRAVNYLTNIMHANRARDWEAGPLGHAIHALVLYDRLVFAKYDDPNAEVAPVASKPRRTRR